MPTPGVYIKPTNTKPTSLTYALSLLVFKGQVNLYSLIPSNGKFLLYFNIQTMRKETINTKK